MAENLELSPGCGMSGYTIPKIADEKLFRDVDLSSKQWTMELYPLLRENFQMPDSEKKFVVNSAKLVVNNKMLPRYRQKKKEMARDGDVEQKVFFIGCTKLEDCHKICSEGVKTGNVPFTHLGIAKMGVVVVKHPDILFPHPLVNNLTYYLIILKIIPGKIKYVFENSSNLEPTPGYDCHMPKSKNTNQKIVHPKQQYANSQMYVYEYEQDGLSERPRQISPVCVVEFRYVESKLPVNVPAKLNAAISTTPKVITVRNSVSVWSGQIENNNTFIANVELISSGMAFKPIALGKSIKLTSTLTVTEMKERYLKNISKLSVKQEFHNGQFYLSYFQMLCEDGSPGFDQLCSYLETTGKAAIWYCGNRVDGVLVSPKSKYLGVLNTQHSDKSLHCFFAAQHSLASRLTLARGKFSCAKSALDTMVVTPKGSMTATNFDEGFMDPRPNGFKFNFRTIAEAFQKQAIDLQIRHPEMINPTAFTVVSNVFPPLPERLQPKRPPLLPTNEQIAPSRLLAPTPKLDPRLKMVEVPKPTHISVIAKPKPAPDPRTAINELANRPNTSRWNSNSTPYSPTQFSPIGDDNNENIDDELESRVGAAMEREREKEKEKAVTEDNFFENLGQFQGGRCVEATIPFLDDTRTSNSVDIVRRNVEQILAQTINSTTYMPRNTLNPQQPSLPKQAPAHLPRRPSTNKATTPAAESTLAPALALAPQPRKQDPRLKLPEVPPVRIKQEFEEKIEQTVANALSEFREKEPRVVEKYTDLPVLSWGETTRPRSEEANAWRLNPLNPLKLSSFTTIYNQEAQIEMGDEKVNEIKDGVLDFADDLMREMLEQRRDEIGLPLSSRENLDVDLTYETLSEELENFYRVLAEVIPVDEHMRAMLQKKLHRTKPQFGGLHQLKCIANALTESLSDKYLNCLLKCEFNKFLQLVENIFSTLFIISESNLETKDVIKDRYFDFKGSLRQLMERYGLAKEGDGGVRDVEMAKFSILGKLTHSNVFIDSILSENRRQLSTILDGISQKDKCKKRKKNGVYSPDVDVDVAVDVAKRMRITPDEVDSDNSSDHAAVTSTPVCGNDENRAKAKAKAKKRSRAGLARRIKGFVKRKSAVRVDSSQCYAQLRRCLVKYKHLKEGERRVANNESFASDTLQRSIRRHCASPARPRVSSKQRQLQNTLLHLGGALTQMCAGGPMQMRKLLTSRGLDLSAVLKELADDLKEVAKDGGGGGGVRAMARRSSGAMDVNNAIVSQQERAVPSPQIADDSRDSRDSQDSQSTLQLAREEVDEEPLYDSLPDAVKNGASAVYGDLPVLDAVEAPPVDEERKVDACPVTYEPNPSYYEDCCNYEEGEASGYASALVYEQPVLPTVDTLYCVYGNAASVGECNNVKDYLNSMGHRPYGSNNKDTVAAAERGVVLYVFVHSATEGEPHSVPDLLSLKQLPNSHFMLFDNVNDLQSQSCRMIFEKGGVIVPDAKLLFTASPGILTHVFSLIKKKMDLEIPWNFCIHARIIQQLENSSEARGLREHSSASSARALGLLNILKVKHGEFVHIMDSHECDAATPATTTQTVTCLRAIQCQKMTSARHIVFVSDLPSADPLSFELQQSGISVMPLIELINRHLITNSDSTGGANAN